jgi:hypothetical protein
MLTLFNLSITLGIILHILNIALHDLNITIHSLYIIPRLSIFIFFLNFNYVVKDTNILHLKLATPIGLVTSQLPPLQNTPPIAMTNLLQAIGC